MQHLAIAKMTSGCFMQREMLQCVLGKPSSGQVREHDRKTSVCQSRGHFWEGLVAVIVLT